MTRRRGLAAEDDPALQRAGRVLRAGVHPGRQDLGASPREGDQGLARGEPRHDRRLGLLPAGRRQARGLRRRALLRRLARGPRLRARVPASGGRRRRRERHPLRHERLQPAGRRSPRRPPRWSQALGERVEVGIHTHNDAECAVANSLAAVDAGARLVQGTMNGYGERCGQREPGLDPARAAAQAGLRVRARRSAAAADRDLALRRRALQPDAGPRPALRRPQRLRPQGRHARRRRAGRRAHLRAHSTRSWSATAATS